MEMKPDIIPDTILSVKDTENFNEDVARLPKETSKLKISQEDYLVLLNYLKQDQKIVLS